MLVSGIIYLDLGFRKGNRIIDSILMCGLNALILKFSISLINFQFLNQGINDNCTNLFAFESYFIESLGPINEYPGHPDYIPPQLSVPEIPYSNLPKATFTAPEITGLPTAAPLARGTRRDCYLFTHGADLAVSEDILLSFKSACDALIQGWSITPEQFAD
ncbi:carbohydrate-binding module family 50 protein [Curvularia clavata]|uniref:Carbohydrate-binding module family 50 protein n=1 Tax=Curvularia clavata TaxID=95742 RepID=A0A9Q9DXQ3_CURCL|nr:carbohydrate-binding module family 50 protein [Curvularia clavata]